MFFINFFKKLQLEQEKANILKDRDQAFNAITFESALQDAALHLKHGMTVNESQLCSLIKRLAVGLSDGTHFICQYEVTVTSSQTGLKSVEARKLD